jgi:hypothetical protein
MFWRECRSAWRLLPLVFWRHMPLVDACINFGCDAVLLKR